MGGCETRCPPRTLPALLTLFTAVACGGTPEPDLPTPVEGELRIATLSALRLGQLSPGGDYLVSGHPSRTSGLVVNEELRIAPGGPMVRLVLRAAVPETDVRGPASAGFEVVWPRASNKVLLRYAPPGGSGQRTFQIDLMGAREVVIRPVSDARAVTVIRGSSRVEWIVEPPDTTGGG